MLEPIQIDSIQNQLPESKLYIRIYAFVCFRKNFFEEHVMEIFKQTEDNTEEPVWKCPALQKSTAFKAYKAPNLPATVIKRE